MQHVSIFLFLSCSLYHKKKSFSCVFLSLSFSLLSSYVFLSAPMQNLTFEILQFYTGYWLVLQLPLQPHRSRVSFLSPGFNQINKLQTQVYICRCCLSLDLFLFFASILNLSVTQNAYLASVAFTLSYYF